MGFPKITSETALIKGSVTVTLARIAASASAFVLFWFISQKSVAHAGEFRTIFVFFLFTEILPLMGMNQFIIREIAVNPKSVKKYLIHSALFSICFTTIIIIGMLVICFFGSYPSNVSSGLMIVILALPASAMGLCLQSILIGLGKSNQYGMIQGFETLMRTITGLILFIIFENILLVIIAFVICRWLILLVYWVVLAPSARHGKWEFNSLFLKQFIKHSPQFAGILGFYLIIRYSSQIMVPWMEGSVAAGYFAIMYQLLDLLLLVPTAFVMNLSPIFATKAKSSISDLQESCKQAIKLISLIIVPGVVFISVKAKPLVFFIFGESYEGSVLLLQMVIWTALIFSLDMILSTAMIASKRQDKDFTALAIGSTVMIVGLCLFISFYGLTGAGIGLCIGMTALFSSRVILFNKHVVKIDLFIIFWRFLTAGLVMTGFLVFLNGGIILDTVISTMAYLLVLVLTGAVNPVERTSMGYFLKAS